MWKRLSKPWQQLAILTLAVAVILAVSFIWAGRRARLAPPRPVLIPGEIIQPKR